MKSVRSIENYNLTRLPFLPLKCVSRGFYRLFSKEKTAKTPAALRLTLSIQKVNAGWHFNRYLKFKKLIEAEV